MVHIHISTRSTRFPTMAENLHNTDAQQEADSVRKSGGHWTDIPRGNIFGSEFRSSVLSIEVRVGTFVSPYGLV